jgi:hypothetical protein
MSGSGDDRPFSEHPYSDLPSRNRSGAVRKSRRMPHVQAPLCAEAQADGVPCYELGRDCETCERAYLSWADARTDAP